MKTIVTEIPSYREHIKGTATMTVGYPWLTLGAIMALEHILDIDAKRKFRIMEQGSGGSTLFFAKRCNYLLSLETDLSWYRSVFEKIQFNKRVEMVCGNLERLEQVVRDETDGSFDMVLADAGPDYNVRQRLMDLSLNKIKRGGWLIIDNYQNVTFDYTGGWDVYTFDGFRHSGRGTRLLKKL